eukprot:CAMPEP_0179063364 /NCGR_PEP_ID=MMETSP0796-20121207/27397_1 /TAXON_ID=73915 /ORGANISM="Pyrodinium bahamense, Strain pbaha01" /LENGTH=294 /DNA_ID=CAMNT_0020760283 /DNA_START=156 /DNA_END=1040 /DNA_ORIENTATION=-
MKQAIGVGFLAGAAVAAVVVLAVTFVPLVQPRTPCEPPQLAPSAAPQEPNDRAGEGCASLAFKQQEKDLEGMRKYWKEWIETRGGKWNQEFVHRMSPHSAFRYESHLKAAASTTQTHHRVLDVGAGPVTFVGYRMSDPGSVVELQPIDSLGKLYDQLWASTGLVPPVRTLTGEAESLADLFPDATFDLVVSRNGLDRAGDPFCALKQMLSVVKRGHQVVFEQYENEALKEGYAGAHQWNFVNVNRSLIIWNNKTEYNVTRELASQAHVWCNQPSPSRKGAPGAVWMYCDLWRLA